MSTTLWVQTADRCSRLPLQRLILVMTCIVTLTLAQPANTEEWVLAGDNMPPWFYYDQSAPKGILHDILSELVISMGHRSRAHSVPFRRIYAELRSGRAHLSVMIIQGGGKGRYPKELHVGQEPLFSYRVVGIALKSRKLKIDSIDELRQFRMGHVRLLPEVIKTVTGDADYTEYGNTEMLLKGVIRQRIDIAITSEPTLLEVAGRLGIQNQLEIIYTLGNDSLHLVWSLPALGKAGESQAVMADQTLKQMKRQGRLTATISKYSDVSVFNNYGIASP